MYVYIKHENVIRRLYGVSLHEYSVPKCGEKLEDRLDPALWFKVLVLDSVLVECDHRNVFWNRDVPSEKDDIHGYKDNQLSKELVWDFFKDKARLFENEDCAEYDPMYEDLFHTAQLLHQRIGTVPQGRETIESVFKLFHMYILPQIILKTEDRNKVQSVLQSLEDYHVTHVDKIEKAMTSERNTEQSLIEQTKDLLSKEQNFSNAAYVASCDREFLCVFLEQLDRFIEHGRLAFAKYAEKTEPLRKSESEEDQMLLKQLRAEKDLLHESFKQAMIVREEIKGHRGKTVAVREKVRYCSFEFQMAFTKTYRGLQIIRDELHRLIKTKIKISAVREAVLLSLSEINVDGSSYGYFRIKGSFEASSDIVDMNTLPEEWATVPAKVNACIDNTDTGLKAMHEEFCGMIKLLCRQLIQEIKGNANPATKRNSLSNRCDNTFSSRWSVGSMSRDSCESICDKTNYHISEFTTSITAYLLDEQLGNPRDLQNRVNMCYSEKVFVDIMPTLCELYEENYRQLVHDLHQLIRKVSATSLCGGDIGILNAFEKQPIDQAERQQDSQDEDSDPDNIYEDLPVSCPVTLLNSWEEHPYTTFTYTGVSGVEPEPIYARPGNRGTRLISRKGSHRKRFGMSLTCEQAGEILDNSLSKISPSCSLERNTTIKGDSSDYLYVDMSSVRIPEPSLDQLYARFGQFKKLVGDITKEVTISGKRRSMAGLLRYVQTELASLKLVVQDKEPVTADDLIDVIILLLCDLDFEDLHKLYAHINLLNQLCPSFMSGSLHAYAVVTINASYLHLFEQAKNRCAK